MEHHKLFDQKPGFYAKGRPKYPEELFKCLASICNNFQAAWDGATGSGQAVIGLADYFDRVYATDISKAQIANAFKHPKITYLVQPSEATDFLEDQFDLVCIAQALHWFDYDPFWPEVKRVLKPGGVFAGWGYSWFSIEAKIDELVHEKILKTLEPYWAEQNKLLRDHYGSVPFPLSPIATPHIPMKVARNLNQLFSYLRSWSSVRRCIEDQGETFFANAYAVVDDEWVEAKHFKMVEMDFCLIIGKNNA
jgi:SAM-dependent methyltransferase